MSEQKFVDDLVPNYLTSEESHQTRVMRDLMMRTFKPYITDCVSGKALELGSEVGYMSEKIAQLVERLDIVEGSAKFIEKVRERNITNITCHHSLFEDFTPYYAYYDYVFASHVLEHVQDVSVVLKMMKNAVKNSGYVFITVPNAHAMSRQLARHMGIIDDLYKLTPNDIKGGHRRVYDRTTLNKDIQNNDFEIIAQGGILFKPFADFQMSYLMNNSILNFEHILGLYTLGNEYPNLCADLYVIARKKQ